MIRYGVECRWVEFGESGVCVLAVETFLKAIDPRHVRGRRDETKVGVGLHCFPVEATFIKRCFFDGEVW